MDGLVVDAFSDSLRNQINPAVIHDLHALDQFLLTQRRKIIGLQTVYMLLQRTDGLHQCALKVVANTHDLSSGLHLRRQRVFCSDKFIERQTRNLNHTVIQHWLEAGIGLSGNGVFNLIQCVAQRDLRSHLCDRVSRRLTCQRGRTAHTGIYLDDAVLEGIRLQGILYVTASGNVQLGNNIECRRTQHLVFLVTQRLRRRNNDGIASMHAHRIDIFHVTYSDTVAGSIPHHLVLDLLPASDTALHQHLAHTA